MGNTNSRPVATTPAGQAEASLDSVSGQVTTTQAVEASSADASLDSVSGQVTTTQAVEAYTNEKSIDTPRQSKMQAELATPAEPTANMPDKLPDARPSKPTDVPSGRTSQLSHLPPETATSSQSKAVEKAKAPTRNGDDWLKRLDPYQVTCLFLGGLLDPTKVSEITRLNLEFRVDSETTLVPLRQSNQTNMAWRARLFDIPPYAYFVLCDTGMFKPDWHYHNTGMRGWILQHVDRSLLPDGFGNGIDVEPELIAPTPTFEQRPWRSLYKELADFALADKEEGLSG